MRNCAGRRLSFFSSACGALHQSNILPFLPFLFPPFFLSFLLSRSLFFTLVLPLSHSLLLTLAPLFFFLLFISISSSFSLRLPRSSPFSNWRWHAFRASFTHLPTRTEPDGSHCECARAYSSARFAHTVSLCGGKKPWNGMKAKLSAPRRIPAQKRIRAQS